MARRDEDIAKVNAEWEAEHGSEEEACDELFGQLYSYTQSGFLVGASSFIVPGTPSNDALLADARGSGLQVPHAYGVLDVVSLAPDAAVDFGRSKSQAQVSFWLLFCYVTLHYMFVLRILLLTT